jgi:hypothetical protein
MVIWSSFIAGLCCWASVVSFVNGNILAGILDLCLSGANLAMAFIKEYKKMKFPLEGIKINPEEAMQSLADVGILPDPDGKTLEELAEASIGSLTYELLEVAVELDTRETSNNCVIARLQGTSWVDLCNRGIEILKLLKGEN